MHRTLQKRDYSLENIQAANPFRARIYLPVQEIERCVDGQYLIGVRRLSFGYFYRPIFKSESRRRSAGFKETSNHTSFLGYSRIVFPFLSVIRIPDGSISIRLAFGSLKIVLLDSSPTRKSIRLILTNSSVAKTKQFANVKTTFFRILTKDQCHAVRRRISSAA